MRNGGAVSRKRLMGAQQAGQVVQVAHLAERDAQLEEAKVVPWEEAVARLLVLAEESFDGIVVGHPGAEFGSAIHPSKVVSLTSW
jgi:hypothetical protein